MSYRFKQGSGLVRFSVSVDEELNRLLESFCASEGLDKTEVVRSALIEYLGVVEVDVMAESIARAEEVVGVVE